MNCNDTKLDMEFNLKKIHDMAAFLEEAAYQFDKSNSELPDDVLNGMSYVHAHIKELVAQTLEVMYKNPD